jgi:hypothetical protein
MRNATKFARATLAFTGLLAAQHGAAAAGKPHRMPDVIRRGAPAAAFAIPRAALPPTWNYQILSGGTYWYETFIGHNPIEQTTAKIPVYIIPIKTVYGDISYSNLTLLATGQSPLQSAVESPVFKSYPFTLIKSNDFGKLQYLDAVEIVNTWNIGGASLAYHTLLDTPVVEPEQTITFKKDDGYISNYFGATNVITGDVVTFDTALLKLIHTLQIPENALPVFLTTQTYLASQASCCYAYFRSTTERGQPFVWASYMQNAQAWSQDVSGLSAVLAGWLFDPYDDNDTTCGGYEASAILAGESNWGATPYRSHGLTYNLTDVALLPYYGDTSGATLNGQMTFQGTSLVQCQDGG